jgi:GAF domain
VFDAAMHFFVRPMVAAWLWGSVHSWRRSPVANDSPHVHAPGTDPDRILVAGEGASAGRGVLTHDLGLPGYLARSVSFITGRATDVDILVTTHMTAATCFPAIASLDLARFDAILFSLGANEALSLTPVRAWRRDIDLLLDRVEREVTGGAWTVVLSIPFFSVNPYFPAFLAWVVDRHVQRLNAATQDLLNRRPSVSFVPFAHGEAYEASGAHAYDRWATSLAPWITEHLDTPTERSSRSEVPDEIARQEALQALGVLTRPPDPALVRLTLTAKRIFGSSIAAVTLIDTDAQKILAATGIDPVDVAREESFCDITIRRATHFVIEDTTVDPRYASYSSVAGSPGVRFYAGYPIESPDGHRIGAFCVMDTQPRSFAPGDMQALRDLALKAQEIVWAGS